MRPTETISLEERLDLPKELSLSQAAELLGVDKKTVARYIRDGVLEWRNIAPPSSSRPTFRIKLESALRFRTRYTTDPKQPESRPRRLPKATQPYQSQYVRIVRS